MSSEGITTPQVTLYMTHRKQGDPQAVAAAKAGLSERTGRRLKTGHHRTKKPRAGHVGLALKKRHHHPKRDDDASLYTTSRLLCAYSPAV